MLKLKDIQTVMPVLDAGVRAAGLKLFENGGGANLQEAVDSLLAEATEWQYAGAISIDGLNLNALAADGSRRFVTMQRDGKALLWADRDGWHIADDAPIASTLALFCGHIEAELTIRRAAPAVGQTETA